MADLFLSYARADSERAQRLATALTAHGLSVWWDRSITPGSTFDDVIQRELETARCVVVLWSRASITSSWVKEEAEEGLQRGVLTPVLLDRVRPPLGFRRVQAADLADWDGDPAHAAFQTLLTAIRGRLDAAATHAGAPGGDSDDPRPQRADAPDEPAVAGAAPAAGPAPTAAAARATAAGGRSANLSPYWLTLGGIAGVALAVVFTFSADREPPTPVPQQAAPAASGAIQAAWRRQTLPLCQATIDDRYPFSATSRRDASLDDVERLFAPGGTLDGFWQTHLAAHVDDSAAPRRWAPTLAEPLRASSLAFFGRVDEIRDALFGDAGRNIGFTMEIRPVTLSHDAARATLTHGDDRVSYAHGPIHASPLSWPARGAQRAGVTITGSSGARAAVTAAGPWALLRLLDDAQVGATGERNAVQARFASDAGTVEFVIRPRGAGPFVATLLAGLRCPDTL